MKSFVKENMYIDFKRQTLFYYSLFKQFCLYFEVFISNERA